MVWNALVNFGGAVGDAHNGFYVATKTGSGIHVWQMKDNHGRHLEYGHCK
jgi:hypothetical protein